MCAGTAQLAKLEQQVRQRTAALRAFFDNAAVGIALMDLEGRVVESNPGLLKMLGYGAGEPEGVRMTFQDTGPDIPPEVLSKLFEPFYTTKEHGLGLGLYVTHSIVDARGGRINVETQMGKGSTFTLWLPAKGG